VKPERQSMARFVHDAGNFTETADFWGGEHSSMLGRTVVVKEI
jgi:hypothetical protein